MIRGMILSIVVLGLAMLLGPIIVNNPGYIMLVVGGVTVEATLVNLLILLALAGFVFWLCLWIVKRLLNLRHISFSFLRSRKTRRARRAFEQGMLAYARHDFTRANQLFDGAIVEPEYEKVKQSMAAYSAFFAGAVQKANQIAATLDADDSDSWYVVADLLCRQNNPQAAVAYLQPKMADAQKDGQLGQLWLQALKAAEQWQSLLEQIPSAVKLQWYSKAQWQQQRFVFYPFAVRALSQLGKFDESQSWWSALPAKDRKSMAVVLGKAWAQAAQGQADQAEQLLLSHLALNDLPAAWPALSQIPLGRSVLQLRKQVQHWLRDHGNNGYLYAVLAYCSEQEGERASAEQSWKKAIQFAPELAGR